MKRRLLTLFAAFSLILCIALIILLARSYNTSEQVTYTDYNANKSWPCPNLPSPALDLPKTDDRAITSIASVQGKLWLIHFRLLQADSSAHIQMHLPFYSRIDWSRPASIDPARFPPNRLTPAFMSTSKTVLGFSTFDMQVSFEKRFYQEGGALRELAFGFPIWWLILLTSLPPILLTAKTLRRRRIKPGLCPTCGYDLRATPTRCPECGTPASPSISL